MTPSDLRKRLSELRAELNEIRADETDGGPWAERIKDELFALEQHVSQVLYAVEKHQQWHES